METEKLFLLIDEEIEINHPLVDSFFARIIEIKQINEKLRFPWDITISHNSNKVCLLQEFIVNSDHRNHGIGSEVLEQLSEFLADQDIDIIILEASPIPNEGGTLEQLIQFYIKNSFEIIEELDQVCLMQKELI